LASRLGDIAVTGAEHGTNVFPLHAFERRHALKPRVRWLCNACDGQDELAIRDRLDEHRGSCLAPQLVHSGQDRAQVDQEQEARPGGRRNELAQRLDVRPRPERGVDDRAARLMFPRAAQRFSRAPRQPPVEPAVLERADQRRLQRRTREQNRWLLR